jgi:hypothetical protein
VVNERTNQSTATVDYWLIGRHVVTRSHAAGPPRTQKTQNTKLIPFMVYIISSFHQQDPKAEKPNEHNNK